MCLQLIVFFRQGPFNPEHPSPENKGVHQKREGVRVVEVQRSGCVFLDQYKTTDSEYIEQVNANDPARDEPELAHPFARKSKDEAAEQRE